MIHIYIKEKAWVARIAAYNLKASSCAIVFGKIICLHNISRNELIQDQALLQHEITHVMQWQKHGYIIFPVLYLWYSLRHGYHNNPFEIEARNMENKPNILEKVKIC